MELAYGKLMDNIFETKTKQMSENFLSPKILVEATLLGRVSMGVLGSWIMQGGCLQAPMPAKGEFGLW